MVRKQYAQSSQSSRLTAMPIQHATWDHWKISQKRVAKTENCAAKSVISSKRSLIKFQWPKYCNKGRVLENCLKHFSKTVDSV